MWPIKTRSPPGEMHSQCSYRTLSSLGSSGIIPKPVQLWQGGIGAAFIACTAGLAVVASQVRPDKLWALPALATVIAHSGTIPQIIDNERNKHTGPLSFVTQLSLTLGSLARVFTTMSEMNDPVVLASFVSSVIVQGALLVQILMYWKNTKRVLRKSKKEKVD